jgi:hypothetical protein
MRNDGEGYSYSNMIDGRLSHNTFYTRFYSKGSKANVDSKSKKVDASGQQRYSG